MAEKNLKVAIVTGASSGIGNATAILLAKEGMKLCLAARRKAELQKVQKACGRNARIFPADIRNPKDIQALIHQTFETFGRIDVLVNSAGILTSAPLDGTPVERIREILDTNLLGTTLCCREVLPLMKRQRSGHIVNISSIAGTVPQENMALYTASKYGVVGFSDALQKEVKPYGIKVSTLRPGTVVTDLWNEYWTDREEREALAKQLLQPEDVARAILFVLTQPLHVIIRDLSIHPNK
ncbi:MAG TPA: SDR family oxidoreductase [Bdellovibrionota bacterium]|nr:SDR family oxidoreductase [Bdellovibrionota bacterium]